jgi:hypothetical protein
LAEAERTYLRVGGDVFPVYGNALRGWSPAAEDFHTALLTVPFAYGSLDELFFALVNLCVGPGGEA